MVSDIAMSVLREWDAQGLKPTPRDIIRLNAFGLKVEADRARNQPDSTFYLPRLARVSTDLAFRQPTVGHDIWCDRIARFVKDGDFDTALAVKAFALSRPAADLPDPDSPASVKTAIDAFCVECRDLSKDQILAALLYVMYGADPADGESPAKRPDRGDNPDAPDREDWAACTSLGVLYNGQAVLWGCSAADLREMTQRQLSELTSRAYAYHGMSRSDSSDAAAEFYAVADEIEASLRTQKES